MSSSPDIPDQQSKLSQTRSVQQVTLVHVADNVINMRAYESLPLL